MLWCVDNVYTPAECASTIALMEASSPTLATNNPLYVFTTSEPALRFPFDVVNIGVRVYG